MTTAHATEASTGWRARLANGLEAPVVQRTLVTLIVLNAVILGMETSSELMSSWGAALVALDHAILAVFVVEIVLRIAAHRGRFFRDPWSVFDLIVIGIALVPAYGPFGVLRALRVLRVLRLLSMLPQMRRVVSGLLSAIPGMMSVVLIIAIVFYVASVIATQLFGQRFPEWFGSLGASLFTLFQVMTLESWAMGIVRPVMEAFPHSWVFFITFIVLSTFTMLNLFIAVIVNAIQTEHHAEAVRTEEVLGERIDADTSALGRRIDTDAAALHDELRAVRAELRDLRALMAQLQPSQQRHG